MSRDKSWIQLVIAGLVLLITTVYLQYVDRQPLASKQTINNQVAPLQSSWSERLFNSGLANSEHPESFQYLVGGIIPHHQVGSRFIFDLLERFPKTTERVIWLIPDHYDLTKRLAYTTNFDWTTPFGVLQSDTPVITSLTENQNIELITSELPFQEHALAGLAPYIRYTLPEAKIVPIAISYRADRVFLDKTIDQLLKSIDDNTIVVASVDFSHNLPLETSKQRDAVSWESINTENWSALLSFNNEYLDSPGSVYVLARIMKEIGADQGTIIDQGNSITELNQNDYLGTSYFEIGWTQSD